MKPKIIFETEDKTYRILEIMDDFISLEDLKGDVYDPKVNPDIDPLELKRQERVFERQIENEGVFGYVLEKWNPEPGTGYEHVDSCWGFVGAYDPNNPMRAHYIVDELKAQIPDVLKKRA